MSFLINPYRFSFDIHASAYFAAMTVQPDDTFKNAVNDFIAGAKSDGFWSAIDAVWFLCANAAQSAYLNAKSPAAFTCSEVGTGSFTAYRGYQGNGATGYLNTGFNPTAAGGSFSLNAASIGVWINSSGDGDVENNKRSFGQVTANPAQLVTLTPRASPNSVVSRLNTTTPSTTAGGAASRYGWRGANRTGSSANAVFINNTQYDFAATSTAILNANMTLGGDPQSASTISPDRLAFAMIGALSNSQMTSLYIRVQACMAAIGAA